MDERELTIQALCDQAERFSAMSHVYPVLYGVTDGKKISSEFEVGFKNYLKSQGYLLVPGNLANGIDFPRVVGVEGGIDMKLTLSKQPQSSSPFVNGREKVYGLGHGLLVFVYEKMDDNNGLTGVLVIRKTIFIPKEHTGDQKVTAKLRDLVSEDGSVEEILAVLKKHKFPGDTTQLQALASEIKRSPPNLGGITISNALQWRLNYKQALANLQGIKAIRIVYNKLT